MPLLFTSFFGDQGGAGGGGGPPGGSGGVWEVIEHLSPDSNGEFDFTGLDLSSYQEAVLALEDVRLDTDGADLFMQFYIGSSLQTSGYRWHIREEASDGGAVTPGDVSDTEIEVARALQTDANFAFNALIHIGNAALSLYKLAIFHGSHIDTGGDVRFFRGSGQLENTGTLDGINISASSTATIDSGQATLFGIRTSNP